MHENVKNLNNQYSLKMKNKSETLTLCDYDSYLKAIVIQQSVIKHRVQKQIHIYATKFPR